MRRATRWGILAAALAALAAIAALAGTTGSHAAPAAKKTVIIGWAFDQAGQMAPFDNPALAAAKIRIKQINAKSKYRFVIKTCDTQNNNPAKAKSCALSLLAQKANSSRPATSTTRRRSWGNDQPRQLAIAPCISQMGPRRFGKNQLAFSFGWHRPGRGGSAAEYAHSRGWKTAGATNTLLVCFKNVVQAFDIRSTARRRSSTASYATGQNNSSRR